MQHSSFVSHPPCDPAPGSAGLPADPTFVHVSVRRAQLVNVISHGCVFGILCTFKRRPHSSPFLGPSNLFLQKEFLLSPVFPQHNQARISHPGDAAAAPQSFSYELYLISSGLFRTTPPIVSSTGPAV